MFDLSAELYDADLASQLRKRGRMWFRRVRADGGSGRPGEGRYADQRVVHQAGLRQGRYGFQRVVILVEQGCEAFSHVANLIRPVLPNGRIDSTF